MFTRNFLVALLERSVRAAASSALSVLVVGDAMLNALTADWETVAGVALGGAVVSALISLSAGALTNTPGPSVTGAERLPP
jgi:hypothetical protein